jgi:hypothetical protein
MFKLTCKESAERIAPIRKGDRQVRLDGAPSFSRMTARHRDFKELMIIKPNVQTTSARRLQ